MHLSIRQTTSNFTPHDTMECIVGSQGENPDRNETPSSPFTLGSAVNRVPVIGTGSATNAVTRCARRMHHQFPKFLTRDRPASRLLSL